MADSAGARERVEKRFVTALNNRRELTGHDRGTLALIEGAALNFAQLVEEYVPYSRHQQLALTHIEDALTRANKGIYTEGALPGDEVPE